MVVCSEVCAVVSLVLRVGAGDPGLVRMVQSPTCSGFGSCNWVPFYVVMTVGGGGAGFVGFVRVVDVECERKGTQCTGRC